MRRRWQSVFANPRLRRAVTGVTTALVTVGCSVTAYCPPVGLQRVDVPNGEYSPAVAHWNARTAGAPFFTTKFPRGAPDPTLAVATVITDQAPAYDAFEYPAPGEAISSAILRVDRGAGIVVRTYRDAEGRLVEEHWRIGESP